MDTKSASSKTRDANNKRQDYLEWEDYFMAICFLSAMRSKDPVTQVGACIINKNNVIIGMGYNGMPRDCSDDEFPWAKDCEDNKHLYVVHAEQNAIVNKISESVEGCTMYVGLFPCNECAKVIIQSGIKNVLYMSDKHAHKKETEAAKRMFDSAKVKYRQYIPKLKKVTIDFDEIEQNNMSQLLSKSTE